MRRVRFAPTIALASAVLVGLPAHAVIKNNEALITGRVLYAMCTNADPEIEAGCATYIRGFLEGARAAAETAAAKPFFCIPDTADTDLAVLAFTRHVERLPKTSMDDIAGDVLAKALWVSFPCTDSE